MMRPVVGTAAAGVTGGQGRNLRPCPKARIPVAAADGPAPVVTRFKERSVGRLTGGYSV